MNNVEAVKFLRDNPGQAVHAPGAKVAAVRYTEDEVFELRRPGKTEWKEVATADLISLELFANKQRLVWESVAGEASSSNMEAIIAKFGCHAAIVREYTAALKRELEA